jgi:hypothetical protein
MFTTLQTVFAGALTAPRSPMAPPTPFVDGYLGSGGAPLTASLPPRTPYTPFSAFASKQNPFDFTFGANLSSQGYGQAQAQAHLLDEQGDPLAGLYNQLLRFVDRELVRIMEAAERICVKSGSRRKERDAAKALLDGPDRTDAADRTKRREESRGFDIMANVVWAEIGRTVMDELGSTIFAAGKPDQFRKVSIFLHFVKEYH